MSKPILVVFPDLLKSHVDQYVRKDGVVVQAHDDKRQAAAPKPAAGGNKMHEYDSDWSTAVRHHGSHGATSAAFHYGWNHSNFKSKGWDPGDEPTADHLGDLKGHYEAGKKAAASHAAKYGNADFGVNDAFDDHIDSIAAAKKAKPAVAAAAEPRLALPKKRAAAKPAPAKTGSAAPARMTNVGSEKYPVLAKTSGELPTKHADGSTHHVGGFEPPSNGKGDHMVQHDRRLYSFTGKSGKNMKTGEASYEYSHKGDSGERRAWVTHSGHLMND